MTIYALPTVLLQSTVPEYSRSGSRLPSPFTPSVVSTQDCPYSLTDSTLPCLVPQFCEWPHQFPRGLLKPWFSNANSSPLLPMVDIMTLPSPRSVPTPMGKGLKIHALANETLVALSRGCWPVFFTDCHVEGKLEPTLKEIIF